MTLWIIVVNLILLASVAGTIPVWIQLAEISKELALIFGLAVLIIAMFTSLLIVRKATMTKKKCYLLYVLIPVAVFLSIIIFREAIISFLFNVLMPIGPGGMITTHELIK